MSLDAANILLCLRYGIGDLVMELPLLDRLRETVPQAAITGLGAEPAIEILDHESRLDAVVPIQHWGIQHLGDPADDQIRQRFADWFAAGHFDLVPDPSHTASVVQEILYQSGTPIRDSDPACLEAGLAQGRDGLSAVKWGVHHGWGLEVPDSYCPAIRLHAEENDWARQFLEKLDFAGEVVALSPGASHDLKRWPLENFVRLVGIWSSNGGCGSWCSAGPAKRNCCTTWPSRPGLPARWRSCGTCTCAAWRPCSRNVPCTLGTIPA